MRRGELEPIVRAAANIAADDEIVIVGSQAILGEHPDASAELLVSKEADLYPKSYPERAEVVDGAIGELSAFHDTFGSLASPPRRADLRSRLGCSKGQPEPRLAPPQHPAMRSGLPRPRTSL